MARSFYYLRTRRLVGMLLASLRSEHTKDVEIAVLHHQLSVLRRQVKRAEFRPADRTLLAALGGVLRRGLDGLAGPRPVAAAQGGANPRLVVARARKPSHASSTADPGPRGWAGAAAAHPGGGPGNGWPAHRGRSSRLPPSPSRSRTCANARHDRPPRPAVSSTAVPAHQRSVRWCLGRWRTTGRHLGAARPTCSGW